MAAQSTNKIKFTMWTPTIRVEAVDTIDDGVVMVFRGLSTPARRAKALEEMKAADVRMTALESAKKETT